MLTLALAFALGEENARAQSTPEEASADKLFDEGLALMEEARAVEACPKLEESQRFHPSGRALFYLAECYLRINRPVSAREKFREAAARARQAHRPDLEELATRRADAVERDLSVLTIHAKPGVREVLLDKRQLGADKLDVPLPVDPGVHLVEAGSWSRRVTVGAHHDAVTVDVGAEEPSATTPTDDGSVTVQRTVGIAAGATGVVAVSVGAVLGLIAKSKHDDVASACPGGACPSQAAKETNDATNESGRSFGTASTVFFVTGGILVVGGLVLYLTAPSAPRPRGTAFALAW